MKKNKFKKDPKLSCVKISGLFQNFGSGEIDPLLGVYWLFEMLGLKM
jgi:hypothetical protein